MPRALTALACCAALLVTGGCGESEQEQAREVVQAYVDAQNGGDFGAICNLYSDPLKAQLGVTDETCPAFVQEHSTGADTEPQFELVGVRVKDETATGDINAISEGGQGPSRLTVTLAREDGEWVIAALQ